VLRLKELGVLSGSPLGMPRKANGDVKNAQIAQRIAAETEDTPSPHVFCNDMI
jgi:hypothetical protein